MRDAAPALANDGVYFRCSVFARVIVGSVIEAQAPELKHPPNGASKVAGEIAQLSLLASTVGSPAVESLGEIERIRHRRERTR